MTSAVQLPKDLDLQLNKSAPTVLKVILNLPTLPADLGSHVPCHLNLRSPVPIILAMLH